MEIEDVVHEIQRRLAEFHKRPDDDMYADAAFVELDDLLDWIRVQQADDSDA